MGGRPSFGDGVSLNKRKILDQAQKFLHRKRLDQALKQYETLLTLDPNDTSARLKVGDIYLRRNDPERAIGAYAKVAEQFVHDGFEARAVALYKQVLQIDASRYEYCTPLGELYNKLGLIHEAINALQKAVDVCDQQGRKLEVLELLRKMAGYDPGNERVRCKLAEILWGEGNSEEALSEYDALATELRQRGKLEPSAEVFEKALELAPGHIAAHVGLAEVMLDLDRLEEAESHAQKISESESSAIDGWELMVRVLERQERPDELQDAYQRLADLHRSHGDKERARDIQQRYLPPQSFPPNDSSGSDEAESSSSWYEEGTAPAEGGQPATEDAEGTGEWVKTEEGDEAILEGLDGDFLPAAEPDQLLAEASVYLRYGKLPKAITCLDQILEIDPNHREALEKLGEAHFGRDDPVQAAALWRRAADVARTLGDRDHVALLEGRIAEIDPEAVARAAKDGGGSPAPKPASAGTESPETPEFPDPLISENDEFEIDVDFILSGEDEAPPPIESEAAPEEAASPETARSEPAPTESLVEVSEEKRRVVKEELEQAEFYLAQKMFEEATNCFKSVLEIAPNHPQALVRLGEIAQARGEDPGAFRVAGDDDSLDVEFAEAAEEPQAPAQPVDPMQLVDRHATAVLDGSNPDQHYDLGVGYREMGLIEHASEAFRRSLDAGVRPPDSLFMLGLCALDLKRPLDAISHFEQSLSMPDAGADQQVPLNYYLGRAFEMLGDRAQAQRVYELSAAINPDFRDLRKRLMTLHAHPDAGQVVVAVEAEGDGAFESFDDLIAEAEVILDSDDPGPATPPAAMPEPPEPAPRRRRKISYG